MTEAAYSHIRRPFRTDRGKDRHPPRQEPRLTVTSLLPFAGLAAAIVTSIFYIFPAGEPQPGDMLLAATIAVTMLLSGVALPRLNQLYATLGLFLCWIILVNGVWFILVGDYTFLRKTSFYIYNAAIMLFIISIGAYDYQRLRAVIYWSCIAALCTELIYIELLYAGAKMRSLGTFNNPNQMGYWGLLMLACLGVARGRQPLRMLDAGAMVVAVYIIAQTLSRAATAAGLLMVLTVLVSRRWQRGAVLTIVGLGLVAGSAEVLRGGLLDRFQEANLIQGLQHRLSLIGRNENDPLSLWKRGYSRLVQHPEYLPLGAGEGAFQRLTRLKDKEFHSSLGNILMSYGVVGLCLLFTLFFVIFRQSPLVNVAYLTWIMLYGITHMGMRDTILWIFLGFVYAQGMAESSKVAKTQGSRADLRLPARHAKLKSLSGSRQHEIR